MASGPATRRWSEYLLRRTIHRRPYRSPLPARLQGMPPNGRRPLLEVGPQARLATGTFPFPVSRFAPFASLALVPPLALLAYSGSPAPRGATPTGRSGASATSRRA